MNTKYVKQFDKFLESFEPEEYWEEEQDYFDIDLRKQYVYYRVDRETWPDFRDYLIDNGITRDANYRKLDNNYTPPFNRYGWIYISTNVYDKYAYFRTNKAHMYGKMIVV